VAQNFPVGYLPGDLVLAVYSDSGYWSNTPDYGRVMGATNDKQPEDLFTKLIEHGTYQAGTHKLVKAEAVDVGDGVQRIKLFTDSGTGTGTFEIFKPTDLKLAISTNVSGFKFLIVTMEYQKWVIPTGAQYNGTGDMSGEIAVAACGTGSGT
jgi:hypothetical protein